MSRQRQMAAPFENKQNVEERCFHNPFEDYNASNDSNIADANSKLSLEWEQKLQANATNLLSILEKNLQRDIDWNDHSCYTGTSGFALLYLKLSEKYPEKSSQYLNEGIKYVERCLGQLKGRRLTFLCGDAGPLAIAAVLYDALGLKPESQNVLQRLLNLQKQVVDKPTQPDLPDELLYGRVGYLYSILFVKKHLGEETVNKSLVRDIISAVLQSGQELSKRSKVKSPLMYEWHDKAYLGAAHGLSGIMYMLLQVREHLTEDELNNLLKPSIDFLLSLQFSSGNFPSSLGNETDRLVHWCHGAPGAIHMFGLAYQVFDDSKYLKSAEELGNVIWERGLLKKGYGICHGTAGNAYGFLMLYRLTRDKKHLYRALKFAEWCFNYGKHGCRIPDRPLSLFEGMAGTVYFMVDLMDPKNSAFPAFQLW